ncbi:hypothetical protein H6784_03630 [Candidatus Nomurabacteria bacterium]|nr:hypothetical protein [Candidatus Kaiserbacteria bacterium]MCB9814480.1 hypothetical protein [Candidatus Nomurabacteria bacterium]
MFNISEKLLATKPKVGEVIFIAIDGHGGSGKSISAKLLSKKLQAEVIHTDDFSGWDNVIDKVFKPIINGAKTLSYQPISWWSGHHPQPITNQAVTKIMILEGVGSSRTELTDYISFNILLIPRRKFV